MKNICLKLLPKLSVGKYNTVFANKGTLYQSSVLGGLITLMLSILSIGYAAYLFSSVIQRAHYNLQTQSIPVAHYEIEIVDESLDLDPTKTNCPSTAKDCQFLQARDFL